MIDEKQTDFDDLLYNEVNYLHIDSGFLAGYDPTLAQYLISLFESRLTQEAKEMFVVGKYCLAGGALRSYYENRPARDLDFYVLDDKMFEDIKEKVSNFKLTKSDSNINEDSLGFDEEFKLSNHKTRRASELCHGPFRHGTYSYPYKQINYVSMDTEGVQFLHVRYVPDYSAKRAEKRLPKKADVTPDDMITASTTLEILEGFDFICCQAALEFEVSRHYTGKLQLTFTGLRQDRLFLTSVAKRELRVAPEYNMQKCGICYYRLHKYVTEYGYKVPSREDFKKLERMRTSAIIEGFNPEDEHYGDYE